MVKVKVLSKEKLIDLLKERIKDQQRFERIKLPEPKVAKDGEWYYCMIYKKYIQISNLQQTQRINF
jgi:hypothetical protein